MTDLTFVKDDNSFFKVTHAKGNYLTGNTYKELLFQIFLCLSQPKVNILKLFCP
jgi:hypothetical protein